MVKILDKLKNIFNKKRIKVSDEDKTAEHNIVDSHDEDLKEQIKDEVEELKVDSALVKNIKKQIPSLYKLIQLINKKKQPKIEKEISPSKEKPKRKLKVIHILFIVGAIFFMFGEEILEPTAEDKQPVAKIKNKKKKVKKVAPTEGKKEEVVNAPINKEASNLDKEKITTQIEDQESQDPLMIGVADSNKEENKKEKPTPQIMDEKKSGEDITNLFKEKMSETDTVEQTNENTVEENIDSSSSKSQVEKTIDENIEVIPSEDKEIDKIKIANELRAKKAKEELMKPLGDDKAPEFLINDFESEDIAKTALKELEEKMKKEDSSLSKAKEIPSFDFVDEPDYSYTGRALVYNCSEGHWACVDVKSYSICEKNLAYNKSKSQVVQCYPKGVYENDMDCEKIQLEYVSNSAATDFCK